MKKGFVLWSEKILQKGEDAQPTFLCEENGHILLAVFDGMGGAGSMLYTYEDKIYSGAYIAANETKKFFEDKVLQYLDEPSEASTHLDKDLFEHLQSVAAKLDQSPSRLRSTLIRRLPTTLAGAIVSKKQDDIVSFLWAGDSRCYILRPDKGLTQVSVDDLKGEHDALKNLSGDAPLSNYCNADVEFRINQKQIKVPKPFVLFTATDGCFGYLKTPFHFEWILLSAMKEAENLEEWKQAISDQIQTVTGDDYSMALCTLGFEDFYSMKELFELRILKLKEDYIRRFDTVEVKEFEAKIFYEDALVQKKQLLNQLWSEYKENYQSPTL